jgi:hypothetical protein
MAKSRMNDDLIGVDVAVDSSCTGKKLRREDSRLVPPQNDSFPELLKSLYFYPRDAVLFYISNYCAACVCESTAGFRPRARHEREKLILP